MTHTCSCGNPSTPGIVHRQGGLSEKSMSDEMDNLIAIKIMGWRAHPRNTAHWMRAIDDQVEYRPVAHTCGSDRWSPSRNLLDAWRVVERITTPCVGYVDGLPWGTRFARLFRDANLWACNRDEAAKDICLLAIRAAGIKLASNQKADVLPASGALVHPVDSQIEKHEG